MAGGIAGGLSSQRYFSLDKLINTMVATATLQYLSTTIGSGQFIQGIDPKITAVAGFALRAAKYPILYGLVKNVPSPWGSLAKGALTVGGIAEMISAIPSLISALTTTPTGGPPKTPDLPKVVNGGGGGGGTIRAGDAQVGVKYRSPYGEEVTVTAKSAGQITVTRPNGVIGQLAPNELLTRL